jgi:3-hydroxyacyl-[acyl-carrier-protein] dehydratase
MRFSLVDKITSLEPGRSITAVKNLSLAEEYLADHFPGFPVMPGVLMLEAMVQAGAWLVRATDDFAESTILLKSAKAVKFNSFVTPGNCLTIDVNLQKTSDGEVTLKGKGTVDGRSTVSARLILEKFNLADRNPELAASDEYRIRKLRELFAELWTPLEQTV